MSGSGWSTADRLFGHSGVGTFRLPFYYPSKHMAKGQQVYCVSANNDAGFTHFITRYTRSTLLVRAPEISNRAISGSPHVYL